MEGGEHAVRCCPPTPPPRNNRKPLCGMFLMGTVSEMAVRPGRTAGSCPRSSVPWAGLPALHARSPSLLPCRLGWGHLLPNMQRTLLPMTWAWGCRQPTSTSNGCSQILGGGMTLDAMCAVHTPHSKQRHGQHVCVCTAAPTMAHAQAQAQAHSTNISMACARFRPEPVRYERHHAKDKKV